MDENQPTEEKTTEEPVAEKVAEENDKAESEPEAEVKGRSSHSYTTITVVTPNKGTPNKGKFPYLSQNPKNGK